MLIEAKYDRIQPACRTRSGRSLAVDVHERVPDLPDWPAAMSLEINLREFQNLLPDDLASASRTRDAAHPVQRQPQAAEQILTGILWALIDAPEEAPSLRPRPIRNPQRRSGAKPAPSVQRSEAEAYSGSGRQLEREPGVDPARAEPGNKRPRKTRAIGL